MCALFSLALIPITRTMLTLMDAMKWDLRARGPPPAYFSRFLEIDGFNTWRNATLVDRSTKELSQSGIVHGFASMHNTKPEGSSTTGSEVMTHSQSDRIQQEWEIPSEGFPDGVVGGYDLVK